VSNTGLITVATGKTLDMTSTASYTLTVQARGGSLTDFAVVKVTVAAECSGSIVAASVATIVIAFMTQWFIII